MQQAATQQQPSERATSIDQLATAPPQQQQQQQQQVPPQLAMQSDTELVNDILQEINQQPPPANAGTVNANSPQQQQQTNDPAFARQMDTSLQHNLAPTDAEQLQTYEAASRPPSLAMHADDEEKSVTRDLTAAYEEPASLMNGYGLFRGFDVVQFAKTILLFMIFYIVISNQHVQTLLCKVPYCCAEVVAGAPVPPRLTFAGTVGVALLAGVAMASVQALV